MVEMKAMMESAGVQVEMTNGASLESKENVLR